MAARRAPLVCSACGYENPSGHRFCGMCGIPLPHAPLTAPGAHSTLSFARAPLDRSSQGHSTRASSPTSGAASVIEMPPSATAGESPRSGEAGDSVASTLASPDADVNPVEAQPVHEMVPAIPLNQYIRDFHYVPPTEPAELDMRGGAAAIDSQDTGAPQPAATPPDLPPADQAVSPENIKVDVDERLGLETAEDSAGAAERPRFLDINQPLAPSEHPAPPSPADAPAPSFLELTEVRQAVAANRASSPRRSGTWIAAALVLALGALGVAEWRARVNQNPNGPLEIIQTKIRDLHARVSAPSTEPPATAETSTVTTATPASPAVQPQPDTQSDSTTNPTSSPAANPPVLTKPSTPPGSAPPVTASQDKTGQPAKPNAPAPEVPTAQIPPKPLAAHAASQSPAEAPRLQPPPAQQPNPPVTDAGTAPGSDEMAKANNASDKAAEAAWLWKATAKGNPDAPVQLADLYVKGEGVPRSCEQAVVLLKTAAAKENAPARNRLAAMYSGGICVQRNRVQAYRWLNSALAADPNSHWARENRNLLWEQMTLEERTQAQNGR